MCIQCRKLQKCLLMQAQTPSPLNSCVSCLSSAPLHITADVYVLRTNSDTHTLQHFNSLVTLQVPTMVCTFYKRKKRFVNLTKKHFLRVTAPTCTHNHAIISESTFTWLPFKKTLKSTLIHVHTQICHVCVFWTDAKVRKHAQTGPKPLRLCEYLCVSFKTGKTLTLHKVLNFTVLSV